MALGSLPPHKFLFTELLLLSVRNTELLATSGDINFILNLLKVGHPVEKSHKERQTDKQTDRLAD